MRISDVIFFGSMMLMIIIALVFPNGPKNENIPVSSIWIGVLAVFVLIPKHFFPNTKYSQWLETDIFKKKVKPEEEEPEDGFEDDWVEIEDNG